VEFVPHNSTNEEPFGFIDLATVICGCHLIPDFNQGRTHELMPASIFWDEGGDWKGFCVAQYVNLIFTIFVLQRVSVSASLTGI
jgi:hypothetical protein